MDSHCQATEEKLDALICCRELQISFALQMLASSGKYPHLRILNFGRLNFVMEQQLLSSPIIPSSSHVAIISSILSQQYTLISSRFHP
jgi:hypothetical protein